MDYSTGRYSDIWSYSLTTSNSNDYEKIAAGVSTNRFYDGQFNQSIRSIEDALQDLTCLVQRNEYDTSTSELSSEAEFATSSTIPGDTSTAVASDAVPTTIGSEHVSMSIPRKLADPYHGRHAIANNTQHLVPENSRFFVIKSFNLENVKSSFQHGVWTSTKRGNKRLSKAYTMLPASAKIFLFFSVNKSGKFCGVAEMKSNIIPTDPRNNIWQCEAGQQFNDLFLVEWIRAADVHNRLLKHFNIMDSDGGFKPITHARDADEVDVEIGRTILKLFLNTKENKASFFDD